MSSAPWTTADIPDQTGRIAVVTGANTGLGLETARELVAAGASVVLAVRNLDKGKEAAAAISAGHAGLRGPNAEAGAEVTLQRLDLSALSSVREAAEELRARYERIDLLVNNAGVMFTPRSTTADGFELQLGTNHLGHFALTGLLLDHLTAVDGSRVVTVASNAHRFQAAIHFDDLQLERRYGRIKAYGQSKLANLLFTYELQRRLAAAGAPTIAVAAHPGGSSTELVRNLPKVIQAVNSVVEPVWAQSAAMGALPTLRAATDPAVTGGRYYGPGGFQEMRGHPVPVTSSARSHDEEVQRRLWAVSEELTGVTFPV